MKPTDFAYILKKYLSVYLPGHYNASGHTILAYRDAFKLLLRYAEIKRDIVPEHLTLNTVNRQFIDEFLLWCESNGNSVATRNQRLATLKAFFRYVQREIPEMMLHCQEILDMPLKRCNKATISYLSVEAVKVLLATPNVSDKYGLRDLAILSLLYDGGARVSEIASLTPNDLHLVVAPVVTLFGKGRKIRQCPLSPAVVENLKCFLSIWKLNVPEKMSCPLFANHKGEQIGRAGIAYILKKYTAVAKTENPSLFPSNISPHMIRHSKAMHLLQAGINLVYIRDWLGHSSIKTTEIYARADSEMKRNALQKAATAVMPQCSSNWWGTDAKLMDWLNSLN